MFLNLKLKIHDFYRKYRNIIIAIIVAWVIMIIVNNFIKNYDPKKEPQTTYQPDIPIMSAGTDTKISSKISDAFNNIVDTYITYCNNKDYEKAYSMLAEDCKKDMFPDILDLRTYIDEAYKTKMVYTVQSYYNKGSIYVFRIRIFEDILATGLTGKEELPFLNELISIDTSKKGMPISINGYINREKLNVVYEDNSMKVTVTSVMREYERETYTLKITNRTEYPIIISDNGGLDGDVMLKLDAEDRSLKNSANWNIAISAGATNEYTFTFNKYFHETDTSRAIKFNNVKIVKTYPAIYNDDGEIQNAINTYSMQINLVK